MPIDPRTEYIARIEARRSAADAFERQHWRLGNLRLGAALTFLALLWPSVIREMFSPWWLLVPAAVYTLDRKSVV